MPCFTYAEEYAFQDESKARINGVCLNSSGITFSAHFFQDGKDIVVYEGRNIDEARGALQGFYIACGEPTFARRDRLDVINRVGLETFCTKPFPRPTAEDLMKSM